MMSDAEVTTAKGHAAAEKLLKKARRYARKNDMAKWQVEAAAGYLQAMKEADAAHLALIGRPIPTDITTDGALERSREMLRSMDFAVAAGTRFWSHYLDKVAPLLGFDPAKIEQLREAVLNPPIAPE